MAETTLKKMSDDIASLKNDLAELKAALLGGEGILSPWAKNRVEKYLGTKPKKFVSQAEIEKEFL